ncbi:MAG: PEP-CTERM sorting domain-containing protein [Cytophagales bacterium]|nr:PEP-CTERM sorting domain-containing protein [Armatimonadota bacterium]
MYAILISDFTAFSATTVGSPGTLVDSQLFLFDGAGNGLIANNDAAAATLQSAIPSGSPLLTALPSGVYYLLLDSSGRDPVSGGGAIFPTGGSTSSLLGPTGPGGGQPLTGYIGAGSGTGTYVITLTGASFAQAAAPEPGTAALGLAAIGSLVGMGGLRRRCRVS